MEKRLWLLSKQKRENAIGKLTIYYYPIYVLFSKIQLKQLSRYQMSKFLKDSLHIFNPNLLPGFLSIVGAIMINEPVPNTSNTCSFIVEHINSVYYFNNHYEGLL